MFNLSPLMALKSDLLDNKTGVTIPQMVIEQSYKQNEWFDQRGIESALLAMCNSWLSEENLKEFCSRYSHHTSHLESVTIIAAGNIPFVSFADVVYGVLCGIKIYIKYSSKDGVTMRWLISMLNKHLSPSLQVEEYAGQKSCGVIATGSANTNRYFNYNFSDSKAIFRSSRCSIAILSGKESDEELSLLFNDIFDYYSQGCRNVSLLFMAQGVEISAIFEAWSRKQLKIENPHFNSCYKRAKAVREIEQKSYFDGGYFIAEHSSSLFAQIGVINYCYYKTESELEQFIAENSENLQCIISNHYPNSIALGMGQQPTLEDFADGVDVMEFLAK